MRPGCSALVLILLASLHPGCGDFRGEPTATAKLRLGPAFIQAPSIRPNPAPGVPLAAVVDLATDVPTRVEISIMEGPNVSTAVAEEQYRTVHAGVPVLGMRPGRTHQIMVTVRNRAGAASTAPSLLSYTTPPLDPAFPTINVTVSEPNLMEPGVTLFNSWGQDGGNFVVMVDSAGEVVWYFDARAQSSTSSGTVSPTCLPNGNLMLLVGRAWLVEIDRLGNVLAAWGAARLNSIPSGVIPVDVDSFHHDIIPLENDRYADFAVLGSELRVFTDYPASEVDPTITNPTANVVGDVVVEFRRDGTVVRRFSMLDLLDPYRMCYDSLGDFWNAIYGMQTEDWSHGNAVIHDPSDDSYIVSVRAQDALVKVARQSGLLMWIFGDPGRWTAPWSDKLLAPIGAPFEWHYHGHAPELSRDGTLVYFDNGNYRAIPPTPPMAVPDQYSRGVEYCIDPLQRTVKQVWDYGDPPPSADHFYSGFLGDCDALPKTGNVLVTDGAKAAGPGLFHARIAEVTHQTPPSVVFELSIRDPATVNPISYLTYRAQRIPSVYPQSPNRSSSPVRP